MGNSAGKKRKKRIGMMKKERREERKYFGPRGPDALGVFVYEWCCGCSCSARAEVRQGWRTNTAQRLPCNGRPRGPSGPSTAGDRRPGCRYRLGIRYTGSPIGGTGAVQVRAVSGRGCRSCRTGNCSATGPLGSGAERGQPDSLGPLSCSRALL